MKIATPVVTILLAAFSVVVVRQAKRAWRDPDWEPVSTGQSPRSPVAQAILIISFAVLLAGGSVIADLRGPAAKDAGAGLVLAGFAGLVFAGVTMETTKRYGRPRFLVPPPLRPGYGQGLSSGPAGPTIADIQEADTERAFEAARWAAHGVFAAEPEAASPAAAEPAQAGAPDSPAAGSGGEFIVIAGPGSHLAGGDSDTGRLVLTTRRLILSTRRPNLLGGERSWPVADMRDIAAGPGGTGLTLRFSDGRAEVFTVGKSRDRGLWLGRVTTLLSLPTPVTSWYGDPADTGAPVTVPEGAAVVVLWRVKGEQRDRLQRYRVLIDGRKAAKIRRGERIELPVPPGRHVIHLRSIWVGSQFIPFEARAGQVLRFCCEPGGFPGMTQADMERDVTGYIRLRRLG
jgi:hypothetical protein